MGESRINFEKWEVHAMKPDMSGRHVIMLTVKEILRKKEDFIERYMYSPKVVVLSECWESLVKAWCKPTYPIVAGLEVIFTVKPDTVEVY